jgi:PAS domain S-box-containing protein
MGLRQINRRLNTAFREWIDRSISNRISVATLSVTVLVLFLLIGATYGFLRSQLDQQAQTTLAAHANTLAARLAGTLEQGLEASRRLADSQLIANVLVDAELTGTVVSRLRDIALFPEKQTIISIHDYRGRPIVVQGAEFAPKGHTAFAHAFPDTQNPPATRLFLDGSRYRLLIAYPLYYKATGTREGALIISLDLDGLLRSAAGDTADGINWSLTGSNGDVLAGIQDSGGGWLMQSVALGPQIKLPDLGISAVASIEEARVLQPLSYFNLAYLLLAMLSLVIAVVLARMVGKRMTEPLTQLSALMANIKDMGTTLQLQLPARSDEIGQLIETFNRMLSELHLSDMRLKQMLRERTERLELTERSLSRVSEESVTFTWTWQPQNGAVLAVSPAIEQLLGYAPALILDAATFRDGLIHDEDRALIDAAVGSLQAGKPLSIRYRLKDVSGRWRWFNDRLTGKFDPAGRLQAIDGICTDVTALQEAEALATQRAQLMDQIYRMSPDGILVTDAAGRATFANPALLRMFGLNAKDVVGRSLDALDTIGQQAVVEGSLYTPMSSPVQSKQVLLRLARPRSMVLARSCLIATETGGGDIFFFRDVSGEAAVERAKSEFLRTAAHELRTPLTSVLGFSEILLNRKLDEETRHDLLNTIHQTAKRLSMMSADLLDVARIDAGAIGELNLQPVSIQPFLQSIAADVTAPDGRCAVLQPVAAGLQAYTDRDRIEVVLRQLLSNAFKFSGPDTVVTLEAEAGSMDEVRGILLRVRDDGIGMSPEVVERVFERFYRADTTGDILGTGLGMSIVQDTLGLLHGRVKLSSEPGKGTEVTIWLPENQLDYIVT